MNSPVPPFLIYLIGAILIPFLQGRVRSVYMMGLSLAGLWNVLQIDEGTHWLIPFLDYELVLGRADGLSLIFSNVFAVITPIAVLYNLNAKKTIEHVAGFVYAGSAIGVILAGDLISLFIFWETLTLCAVALVLARDHEDSRKAAFRYLLFHIVGGLILLAGICLYIRDWGTAQFGMIGTDSLYGKLIFLGFGVNCAWPLLHTWLPDAYPKATVGGVIFMATFTTKSAVYALARAFPGEEILIWIGGTMAVFPILFAILENDLRKILSYSLINQVGYMVVGVGVGTSLALNGTAAHAYSHILYKALLFMAMGAIIQQTGKIKATELGGLFRKMPWTCAFCIIGALSVSAAPGFSGFVSKSMIMSAAVEAGHVGAWVALLFAGACVMPKAGLKLPYFAFFGRDSKLEATDPPKNMLWAMALAAAFCIGIGCFPGALYAHLPNQDAHYQPYTLSHVVGQVQLLSFSALAFFLLLFAGLYPSEKRATILDADFFYRRGLKQAQAALATKLNGWNKATYETVVVCWIGGIAKWSSAGTASIAAACARIGHRLRGTNPDAIAREEESRKEAYNLGATSISLTALMSIIIMALLILL